MPRIELRYPAFLLLYTLLWLLLRAAVWLRQGRIDRARELALLPMYLYLAVVWRFVMFPLFPENGRIAPLVFDPAALRPVRLNLVPIVHILRFATRRDMLLNLLGNVALFLPAGALFPALYPKLDRFRKVLCAGMGLSLFIELAQLPFAARGTDVDDLLLNTLGTALGCGLFALIRRIRRQGR